MLSHGFTSLSGKSREFLMLDRELDNTAYHLNLLEYDGKKINQIAKAAILPPPSFKTFELDPTDVMLSGTKVYIPFRGRPLFHPKMMLKVIHQLHGLSLFRRFRLVNPQLPKPTLLRLPFPSILKYLNHVMI